MSQVLIAPNGAEQVRGPGDQTVMKSDLKKATLQEVRQQAERMKGVDLATFAAALDVEDLDDREAAMLAVAQRVYREDRGCDTPIEKFIRGLLGGLIHRPLGLEDIVEDLNELKDDWRNVVQIARRLYVEHRELVIQERPPESEPEQEDSHSDDTDTAYGQDAEDDQLEGATASAEVALYAVNALVATFPSPSAESALNQLHSVRDEIAKQREEFEAKHRQRRITRSRNGANRAR